MNKTYVRLVIATASFLVFWWASTVYYMKYIYDIGGTYWSMGVYGLPAVLIVVWGIDFCLMKITWFQKKYKALTAIDSLLAIVFYFPSSILVLGTIRVFGIA